jgi:hypothetical protein
MGVTDIYIYNIYILYIYIYIYKYTYLYIYIYIYTQAALGLEAGKEEDVFTGMITERERPLGGATTEGHNGTKNYNYRAAQRPKGTTTITRRDGGRSAQRPQGTALLYCLLETVTCT